MRVKHLHGPQRLRRTITKGQEVQFHFDHAAPPLDQNSATTRGPPQGMVLQWEKGSPRWASNFPNIAGPFPRGPLRSHFTGSLGEICRAGPLGVRWRQRRGGAYRTEYSDPGGLHSRLQRPLSGEPIQQPCPSMKAGEIE